VALDPELWAVYPSRFGSRFADARQLLRTSCNARGWQFQERPSNLVRPPGQTLDVLKGLDATEIYRRAHRAHVGVVVFAPTFVCLHPVENEALSKKLIARLQRFLEYKCFVRLCDQNTAYSNAWADELMGALADYAANLECDGERDPRCLPLHVFKNSQQYDLRNVAGRTQFDIEYGNGQRRIDDEERTWRLVPRLFHGQEALHVRGTQLRQGLHWDVEPNGDSTLIITTAQVWKVKGYINVYPDSHLRVTQAGKAIRVV